MLKRTLLCLALLAPALPAAAQYAEITEEDGNEQVVAEEAAVQPKAEAEAVKKAAAAQPAVKVIPPSAAKAEPPAPAIKPAVEPKKPEPVYETVTAAKPPFTLDSSELDFLKRVSAGNNEDVQELVLPQVTDWLAVYPASEFAPEAQLLKAQLHYSLGDWRWALVDLLRHFQSYPAAADSAAARKLFADILQKKADKKLRPVMEELAKLPAAGGTEAAVSLLLEKLAVREGEAFYGPLCAEFREFLNRFPAYAKNDELRMALADMHLLKGEPLKARLEYEKLIRLHPGSALEARAKIALAGVLAGELKDYENAIAVYQDVTAQYPGTAEAWTAYARLPQLCERQKKFPLAIDVYERVIALYPEREEAFAAFNSEARVLRDDMDKPAEAAAVLDRLASKYKGARAVEALLLAAEIRRKDMKDTAAEVKTYDRIAAEYPSYAEAPKALYAAGEALERAKDPAGAREYYVKVSEKYADSASGKKALKRMAAIDQAAGGK